MEALEAIAVGFLLGLIKDLVAGTLTPPPVVATEAEADPAVNKAAADAIDAFDASGS